ncbi:MAG: PAS domain S-box protein, partial [Betaproteobacteria bacterium]
MKFFPGFLALAGKRIPPVRAVALLAVGAVIAVLVATTTLLWDLRERELIHARGGVVSLSRVLGEQTTRAFEGVDLVLRGFQDRLSDDIGQKLELDHPIMHLMLRSRIAGQPQIASVFVVDANGEVRSTSRSAEVRSPSVAGREYFSAWKEGRQKPSEVYISQPTRNMIDGKWTLHLSRRLTNLDGQFRGVVVANIELGYFETLYASIRQDFVSHILLFLRDGTLIMSQPHEAPAIDRAIADMKALGRKNPDQAEILVDDPEVLRSVAYRAVDKFPLVVGVAISEHEALAPWRNTASSIAWGAFLVSLAIGLAGWWLARELKREQALAHALNESDARMLATVQALIDAVVTVNRDERILLFNRAAEKMFGYAACEVIGQPLQQLLPGPALEALRQQVGAQPAAGNGESLAPLEIVCRHRKGFEFPVETTISRVVAGGELLLTAILRDVSDRQQAETRLRESNRQLRDLSAALQDVREDERTRIARELHDELGQKLTGLKLELSWLSGRMKNSQPEMLEKIESMKSLVSSTVEEARRISSELRPLMLDDLGFAAAAEWTAEDFSRRTGIRTQLDLSGAPMVSGDPLATALFRILQESLTNVMRYAEATEVGIALHCERG